MALSSAHSLTRSLLGSPRRGCVATVYPALVTLNSILNTHNRCSPQYEFPDGLYNHTQYSTLRINTHLNRSSELNRVTCRLLSQPLKEAEGDKKTLIVTYSWKIVKTNNFITTVTIQSISLKQKIFTPGDGNVDCGGRDCSRFASHHLQR